MVLERTNFPELGERYEGKVRDVYDPGDETGELILVATDRFSSFDRHLALVPDHGAMVTQISRFWFALTRGIVRNHTVDYPDPNVAVARKYPILPVEVVVRGHVTGVTKTSLWSQYEEGQRNFGDFVLPEGLHKNERLEVPVLTPTTKSEEHDAPRTSRQLIEEGLATAEQWEQMSDAALRLFKFGQEVALRSGLILVDTKYEFGLNVATGQLVLADEIHTPDSSRYWKADDYEADLARGVEPENFDKEFLRLWLKKLCDPYAIAEIPPIPTTIIRDMSDRYIYVYGQLTGSTYQPDTSMPIEERIRRNMQPYMRRDSDSRA